MNNINKNTSKLNEALAKKKFVITAETTPKTDTDLNASLEKVLYLKGLADAVNITDGAGAKSHLSSLVLSGVMKSNGIEPIIQLTLRDKNRIAIQSDIIGASAMGVTNFLVLTGDPAEVGDEKQAKFVGDFEQSTDLISLLTKINNTGELNSGRNITNPPEIFLGAADAPFLPPSNWKPDKLIAKVNSGAQFFQTQYCFDMKICKKYFSILSDFGLLKSVYFLVGIGPFSSSKQAIWMHENLPGVEVPDRILNILSKSKDQKGDGKKICLELLNELHEIDGVSGAHIMGPGQEQTVAEIIQAIRK
ncbi:MAG: Bifunctional homocysteine S-methyltransferase/5,10-methylenetetrahydrofolate reductase [Alphaproteobacteria bacterium MarineAlpha2_Bin1]|nr:MAG: Bifunctional homocysteine S-methyltransferase/5,10-methylenetetrahydrofolate reductase [Alphaproteobacteria bacterium MarineAlpha2_Bin1]